MKILKIFLFLTAVTFYMFGNPVEVKISSNRVSKGERLSVKIVAEGGAVEFPQIDKIDGIAVENVRKLQKYQARMINQKIVNRQESILEFELYPDKNITIPQFIVKVNGKEEATEPIDIEVIKSGKSSNRAISNFGISMKIDKKSALVGEPLILTVEAYEPSNGVIAQLDYIPPKFKDFFVKTLGKERTFNRDSKVIHELKYLLTPQKEGKNTILPAQLKVGIELESNARNDPFGLFSIPIKSYSLRANPITVDIKSPPNDVDLIGNFKIKAKVDKTQVKPNQPVNYTLTIKGQGNLEDLEDPVFEIPNVTIYSDDAIIKSRFENGRLISSYSKKYVFISNRSFSIPSVKLREFNYVLNSKRVLKSQSFDIQVLGTDNQAVNYNGIKTPKNRAEDNGSILEDSVFYIKKEYEEKEAMLTLYTLVAFLAGMMAMFAIMKLFKKNKRIQNLIKKDKKVLKDYTVDEALEILYPHTSDSPEVEKLVKKLYLVQKGKRAKHIINKEKLQKIIQYYDKEEHKQNARRKRL